MAKSLGEVMRGKSNEGLTDYINNFNKYTPEAIAAAVNELKKRGKKFSSQELEDIDLKIQARAKAEKEEPTLWVKDVVDNDLVIDPNAPLLYSKGAIRAFSFIFTTLFGAFLLSDNVIGKKNKFIVIGFGIAYTTISAILLNIIPSNTFWVLALNAAGGLGLTTTFWDKYVGKDMKYRSKPIWLPLIISIIITIPLFLIAIYSR